MASFSSESHIVSSGASSWRRSVKGRGASRRETQVEDLLIDIDVDVPRDEVLPEFGAWRCRLRPRFPPHQAWVDARTEVIDRGIRDTHL